MKFSVTFLFILILSSLAFMQCNKDEEGEVLFEEAYTVEFDMPAALNPFEVHFFTIKNIDSRILAQLDQRGINFADVEQIGPGFAELREQFGVNYDYIQEISIQIFKDDPNNWRELFYRDDTNLLNAGSTLEMIPSLSNAKPMLDEDQFNLTVRVVLRVFPPSSTTNRLDFSLRVLR